MLLRPRRAFLRLTSTTTRRLLPDTTNNARRSSFNHRTMASSSSTNGKYAFLAELGLSSREPGVFDGRAWQASGPVRQQVNPATGEVIGEVHLGTAADYERVVAAMDKVRRRVYEYVSVCV